MRLPLGKWCVVGKIHTTRHNLKDKQKIKVSLSSTRPSLSHTFWSITVFALFFLDSFTVFLPLFNQPGSFDLLWNWGQINYHLVPIPFITTMITCSAVQRDLSRLPFCSFSSANLNHLLCYLTQLNPRRSSPAFHPFSLLPSNPLQAELLLIIIFSISFDRQLPSTLLLLENPKVDTIPPSHLDIDIHRPIRSFLIFHRHTSILRRATEFCLPDINWLTFLPLNRSFIIDNNRLYFIINHITSKNYSRFVNLEFYYENTLDRCRRWEVLWF